MIRKIMAVLTAALIATLMGGSWAWATNTNPNEDHKVTICHRTGSADGGELKNGYNEITVDIASSGYVKGGHANHEQVGNGPGPDIIPAYEAFAKDGKDYVPFSYPGKGLDWVFEDGTTGAEFLANGCALNTPVEPVVTDVFASFGDPTCKVDAGIAIEYNNEQASVVVEGKVEAGSTVTVTFTANEGYVIEDKSVFEHTYGEVPADCDKTVTKVTKDKERKVNCDGVFTRTITTTTVDGEVTDVNKSEWTEVRNLTHEQKVNRGCINPPEPNKPNNPDKPGNPDKAKPELPHTGANPLVALFGGLLTLVGAGLVGMSRLTGSV